MAETERRQRADATRNRERVLAAASEAFREHGLEVGVGEIAQRAGVGRGTLFRNFPTKQDLIAAIVVERMRDAVELGRELLSGADRGEAPFTYISEIVGRQQIDRALFDSVADEFLQNAEISAAHTDVLAVLETLLDRGKEAGTVRGDVGPVDVLLLVKGVCAAAGAIGDASPEVVERHLDLVRAAISPPAVDRPLRGKAPTMEALVESFPQPAGDARSAATGS